MIEFSGYITGRAADFFWNNSRRMVRSVLLAVFLIALPIFLVIAVINQYWELIIAYICFCLITLSTLYIPRTKKEKTSWLPKKISIDDDEYIVCVGDKYEEYSYIGDVDQVIDYGDFYYISFPFGKKSDKFICQKNLLTKGTLADFESVFVGKIVKHIK